MFSINWSLLVSDGSFTKKACKFAIKRGSKFFHEITKGLERLQQNALVKLHFSDSDSEQI